MGQKNYQSNRTKIRDKYTLEEGLPQHTALSCTLSPDLLNTTKLFADDLVIWTSSSDLHLIVGKLHRVLLVISSSNFWKLGINASKITYSLHSSKMVLKSLENTWSIPRYEKLDRKLNFRILIWFSIRSIPKAKYTQVTCKYILGSWHNNTWTTVRGYWKVLCLIKKKKKSDIWFWNISLLLLSPSNHLKIYPLSNTF